MSKEAPWIALAIDWQDSEMLDNASHGERLAWICLLCFAKAQGRAGRVRLRDMAFAKKFDLGIEVVRSVLAKAKQAGAVIINDDVITVVNWKSYQDPGNRTRGKDDHKDAEATASRDFSKTAGTPPPTTPNQPPPTKPHITELPPLPPGIDDDAFREVIEHWVAYKVERREGYKQQGLTALVSHVAKIVGERGREHVFNSMNRAMANGWKGWEQDKSTGSNNGKNQRTSHRGR